MSQVAPASAQAGSMVAALCGGRGCATGKLFIFRGLANHLMVCLFPAPCGRRRKIVLVNLPG